MALKPKIFESVLKEDVKNKLPKEFRNLINQNLLKNSKYSVICYSSMKGDSGSIVGSKSLIKALKKVKSNEVIAVSHSFTEEAILKAKEENIIIFYKSDFFWTDGSWANIRDK